ncbi:MAG: FecR domain-containing protein [Undibacterium sp.]|nr:FecR domain-containing protein [Opitutaceae bacterium]
MNALPSQPSPAAHAEAALWAARLDGGTLEAADRVALDTWLAASPAHRALLSSYCQFSADLELQLPALVGAGRINLPPPAVPRRSWSFKLLTTCTLAAAAVAIALTVHFTRSAALPETFATAVAQRQSITLADGTRVELNARTSLQIALGRTERRVRLASGEAFFQVTKDPSRPFIVETPAGAVRVTGTTFNVLAESPSALDVTVVEGSVQVHPAASASAPPASSLPPPASYSLAAGDHLSARATSGVTVKKLSAAALANTLAWRRGTVVFDDVPLAEALARFAHYHGRDITASSGAARLHISSRFSLDDLEGFFVSLGEMELVPVKITRDPASGSYHISLRTEK